MRPGARPGFRAALLDASDDLLAYFERRVAVREDAADLLAETLLQAWRRCDSLPAEPERRRMWLFGIASRVLANQRRGNRRRLALADRLRQHLGGDGQDSRPDHGELHEVRDAVRRLAPEHRELVMLVHWDGFSIAEAAQLLDLNASTARSRYAAAREQLRRSLDPVACG